MKKYLTKAAKILGVFLLTSLVLLLVAHAIGHAWNQRTPDSGINESLYVDINGSKQWINIYGQNKKNPVLLYLHGGPGSSTSAIDYAFTRKWADIYTIVTWDQRNCGKSYDASQNNFVLTKEVLMEDGKEITEFLQKHMGVDKITILGHSWGSLYGANLIQAYPQYYNLFIGTGQLVDPLENEKALKEAAEKWASGDGEAMQFVEALTPEKQTMASILARNALLDKYGYSMMKDGSDYCLFTTVLFNPNYGIKDWIGYFRRDWSIYLNFIQSEEFKAFSLKGKNVYHVPYVNINGDMDYQANYRLAEDYFTTVRAPQKELYLMKDTSHGLLESKSEEFSKLLHEVFKKFQSVYR